MFDEFNRWMQESEFWSRIVENRREVWAISRRRARVRMPPDLPNSARACQDVAASFPTQRDTFRFARAHESVSAVEADQYENLSLHWPSGESCFNQCLFVVSAPLVFLMKYTIPDVRVKGRERWCYVTFIVSILWIGACSGVMVKCAQTVGDTAQIPSVVMGLTILAAGTSVPDLLSRCRHHDARTAERASPRGLSLSPSTTARE
jgi:Ca2+/Na+ antiporter